MNHLRSASALYRRNNSPIWRVPYRSKWRSVPLQGRRESVLVFDLRYWWSPIEFFCWSLLLLMIDWSVYSSRTKMSKARKKQLHIDVYLRQYHGYLAVADDRFFSVRSFLGKCVDRIDQIWKSSEIMMDDRRRSWRKVQLNSRGIRRTASNQATRRSMMLSVMLLITRLSLSVRHFGMEIVKWIHFYGSFFTSMKWTDQYLPIKEAWMLQRFSDAMGTIEELGKQVWFSYVPSTERRVLQN